MAYTNFQETIWSKYIEHELPKLTVFENDCDYRFKGEVGRGKTVKILGVERPTIGNYTGATITAPTAVNDKAVELKIDQAKYFNFMVDDVDEAQAKDGLMQALMEESNRAMAEERDKYIAQKCTQDGVKTVEATITTPQTAKAAIDAGIEHLWANGVSEKDDCTMYLSPKVYMLMMDYIVSTKNKNDALMENGLVGKYMGFNVKMTNNLYTDELQNKHIILKTSKGFAFASGINEVEAYRPQGLFSDAVKGLNTFGGKVCRPNEIYVIKAKNI